MNFAFLITAYNQLRELCYTHNLIRNVWGWYNVPIIMVVSGDESRELLFNDDIYTRIVHLDDMVGDKVRTLVSTSIMRQIEHGMLEIKDLERELGPIASIVHMHADILLLDKVGFLSEMENWKKSDKPVAADPVGAQAPIRKDVDGGTWDWAFYGYELMPQLFAVNHAFCKATGYLYSMTLLDDLERKSTEWALIGNLHRAVYQLDNNVQLTPKIDVWKDEDSPYRGVFEDYVYVVNRGRPQWGQHSHWGGFTHYGNQIHIGDKEREQKEEAVLRSKGLSLDV